MLFLHFLSVCLHRPMNRLIISFKFCKDIVRLPVIELTWNSAELEMTVNMLIQIDKLVQLLESPVFTCQLPFYSRYHTLSSSLQTSASNSSNQKNTPTFTNVYTASSCSSPKAQHSQH